MEPLNENMAAFNLTINHSIPEDLVLRILSKLPIKSLKRFQCVQKSWNNLLDDPHFVKMYYENLMSKSENCDSCIFLKQEIPNTDQHNMFFLSGERYENKMKLDLPPTVQDNECFKVLGSCVNGIICLVPYGPEFNDTRNVVFWNPTTNEFKGIPPDLAVMLNYYFYISYKGFGYDSLRDDYILIRIGQYSDIGGRYDGVEEDEPSDFFETYYPNGQLRRQISDYLLDEDGRDLIDFAIYLNGTCHWRSRLQKDPYVDRSGTYKVTFVDTLFSVDIGNNKLTTTSISEYKDINDEDLMDRKLVALNSYVATITMCLETKCIDISILGEVGVNESWIKLFTIRSLSSIEGILGIGIKGDLLLRKNDDELVSFDLGTQQIQEIGIKGSRLSQTLIYEKNFLPIGRITN